MTTASWSFSIDHQTDAAFRAWGSDVNAHLAAVGLKQTIDTGQINWSTVTRPGTNTSGGYEIWCFNDSLSSGPISSALKIAGGSGYTNNTYTNVPLTGGSGSGAQATIVVSGGAVSTVTITAAGTGYKISDTLSASNANLGGAGSGFTCMPTALTSGSPIVIRFDYGTGSSATRPRMQITVGTSTNGSGTIGGTAKTTIHTMSEGSGTATGIVSAQSWMCAVEGAWWCALYMGAPNANRVYFGAGIMRSCDSNGTPDGNAALVWFMTDSNQAGYSRWPLRFAATANAYAEVLNNSPPGIVVPSLQTGTVLPNGNNQIFTFWTWTPQASPLFGKGVVMDSELAAGNTLSVALVGTTARTLLNMGVKFGTAAAPTVTSVTFDTCLIWE